MANKRTETLVGALVLSGIAGTALLALKAADLVSLGPTSTYTVQARFDNIGGLKKNAPVRCAGVAIGAVLSISLDPDTYQGVVTMKLHGGLRLPADSSAEILAAGLLGDEYVGVEPGSDGKDLANGDLIKKTRSAVVLENVIGQLIFDKAADAGSGRTL